MRQLKVQHRIFQTLLTLCLIVLTNRTHAANASSEPSADRSCAFLFSQILVNSDPPHHSDLYGRTTSWEQVRHAIENASNQSLSQAFELISKQNLEETFWRIQRGEMKMTSQDEIMITQLMHMVIDLGDGPFWGPTKNRAAAIREAIQRYDAGPGSLDRTQQKTEIEILARAVSEHYRHLRYPNSGWADPVGRWITPYYEPLESILAAGKQIRRQVQRIAAIEQPIRNLLEHYHLTEADREVLQRLLKETANRASEARRDLEQLYGTELANDMPLLSAQVNIREIGARAAFFGDRRMDPILQSIAEKNLDVIEKLFDIPLQEKTNEHLQIRNVQFRRESHQLLADYLGLTLRRRPPSLSYRVRTTWVKTVIHEDHSDNRWVRDMPDPKGVVTRVEINESPSTTRYPKHHVMKRNDVMPISYEEILQGRVTPSWHIDSLPSLPEAILVGENAVSATNGRPTVGGYDQWQVKDIIEQSARMRKTEAFFRNQIHNSLAKLNGLTTEVYKTVLRRPEGAQTLASELMREVDTLRSVRERLRTYQQSSAEEIYRRWHADVEQDFRDRNLALLNLYDHAIYRTLHLAEQVRREPPSLIFENTLPNYDLPLGYLQNVRDRNQVWVRNAAIGVGIIGVTAANLSDPTSILNVIHALTGIVTP